MFKLIENIKNAVEREKKIKRLEDLISEQNDEWATLYIEKKELERELEATIEGKDIAEKRNVEYARTIKAIADELNTNQYNSVLNLSNKIKSMLAVGKHF